MYAVSKQNHRVQYQENRDQKEVRSKIKVKFCTRRYLQVELGIV